MRILKMLPLCAGLLLAGLGARAEEPAAAAERSLYQAVDVARQMMNSQDIYDRILAAGALSDIGDTQALQLLERCIGIDDIVIRRSAIDTLISGSHPNSVNLLFKAAAGDGEVLGLMAESLASVPRDDMGDLLLEALGQSDFVKKHALQALVRSTGSAESAAVRALVSSSETSPVIRAYGNYALLSNGDRSVGAAMLERVTASSNADELEVTAVALGLLDSKESRAALEQLSKQEDQRVVLAAIASKAALGDEAAVAQIIKTIGYGKPMEATVMAGALKRLPPPLASQITETLLACCPLKNDAATRLLESWGWIASDATKVYDWGLAHREADIRMQTIWLIGQRRDETALSRLAPFLTDEDAGIRGMAAWAIVHIAGHRYVGGIPT
jgi:HEAT repeat protein